MTAGDGPPAELMTVAAGTLLDYLNTAHPDEVTASDVIAVSRYMSSGVGLRMARGGWRLTRADLLRRRMSPDAWITRDDVRVQLTLEAAAIVAEDLNTTRPWQGGDAAP